MVYRRRNTFRKKGKRQTRGRQNRTGRKMKGVKLQFNSYYYKIHGVPYGLNPILTFHDGSPGYTLTRVNMYGDALTGDEKDDIFVRRSDFGNDSDCGTSQNGTKWCKYEFKSKPQDII